MEFAEQGHLQWLWLVPAIVVFMVVGLRLRMHRLSEKNPGDFTLD